MTDLDKTIADWRENGTPGPWKADLGEAFHIRESDCGSLAQMRFLAGLGGIKGKRDVDAVANTAHLIAAAPAMADEIDRLKARIYRVASPAKDSINWENVAGEFICMAREKAGMVWIYTEPPKKTDFTWRGIGCRGKVRRADAFASYKRGTCDWRDSLVFRPGHEPKGEQT